MKGKIERTKIKKIVAWVVIVILGLLYLTTLILAICGSTLQSGLFVACLYLTIVLPVLAFVIIWLFDHVKGRPGPGDKITDEKIRE